MICPKCKSKQVIEIIYGMPSSETIEQLSSGKIKLGGCCVTNSSPDYECSECGYRWQRKHKQQNEFTVM